MKTKKVNRYYCDFCNKSGCSSGHMKRHESICFLNPKRACPVCHAKETDVEGNLKRLDTISVTELLAEIECPTCVLAAVVKHNRAQQYVDDMIEFDYKESLLEYRDTERDYDRPGFTQP